MFYVFVPSFSFPYFTFSILLRPFGFLYLFFLILDADRQRDTISININNTLKLISQTELVEFSEILQFLGS